MRAELHIRGPIDPDIVSEAYVSEFIGRAKAAGFDALLVCIDSTGGDVHEASAIYRALKESGLRTTALIEGVCESSATIVALACDRVLARPHVSMFFHEPSSVAVRGKASELEALAANVREVRDAFAAIYCERTGLPRNEARALMANETRLNAYEAQRLGFVHHVLGYGETDPAEESAARIDALLADVEDLLRRSREEVS